MHKGFPVGLKPVAGGFGLAMNKTGSGKDAIDKWILGDRYDRIGVVKYCESDVTVLCMVVSAISSRKKISWITKSQNKMAEWVPSSPSKCLMRARDAMSLWTPDNKWMSHSNDSSVPRLTKQSFIGWPQE